jgi:hypothetical protein
MTHALDTQEAALGEASTLRRRDHAVRLAKAVTFWRNNSELGFSACARLFHVGEGSLKAAVRP